jgi:hypothetical protein
MPQPRNGVEWCQQMPTKVNQTRLCVSTLVECIACLTHPTKNSPWSTPSSLAVGQNMVGPLPVLSAMAQPAAAAAATASALARETRWSEPRSVPSRSRQSRPSRRSAILPSGTLTLSARCWVCCVVGSGLKFESGDCDDHTLGASSAFRAP